MSDHSEILNLTSRGDAWRITGLTLTVAWSTGNQTIMTPVDD